MHMGSMLRFMLVAAAMMMGCGGESRDSVDCTVLTAGECDANTLCAPIRGAPMNVSENCFDTGQFVICAKGPGWCADAIFYARDSSGTLWQFPNSCTPPDWPVEFPDEDTMMAPYCSQLR